MSERERSSPIVTMHAFTRKHKPRPLPHTTSVPTHNICPAPRARVTPPPASHTGPPHASATSSLSPPQTFRDAPRAGPAPTSPVTPASTPVAKRRRRFRKKVSGLFGDQTDLKRRMDKLIRDIDPTELLDHGELIDMMPGSELSPADPSVLPKASSIVDCLSMLSPPTSRESTPQKKKRPRTADTDDSKPIADNDEVEESAPNASFDSPVLVKIAHDVLGSPERLTTVRSTMGSLDPTRNEKFLQELEFNLDQQPDHLSLAASSTGAAPSPKKAERRPRAAARPPTPPRLPRLPVHDERGASRPMTVRDAAVATAAASDAVMALSGSSEPLLSAPAAAELAAAPAVLRRKVRRVERGYRVSEVLEARRNGVDLASSLARARGVERTARAPEKRVRAGKSRLREGNLDDFVRVRKKSKRESDERAGGSVAAGWYGGGAARSSGSASGSAASASSTDEVEVGEWMEVDRAGEKRKCMSTNPLDMLVAVATVSDGSAQTSAARRERSECSGVSTDEAPWYRMSRR